MLMNNNSSGAMKVFLRAALILCCALAFSSQAETIPVSNSFDHARTGYMLRDVHTALMCEQCHVEGIFKNTPRDCAGCHSTGSRVGATPKPLNHPQTNKACDACHTSPTSFLVKNFNHAGVTKDCISCHNGQSSGVVSKSATHFPTTLACEACHINTATFSSTRNNHTGSTTNCVLCHGGQYPAITSKAVTHIATNAACDTCHDATNTNNFTTFLGAQFDHFNASPSVANRCTACHNGGTAIGKSVSHIPTTGQCDTCHTSANTNNFSTFQGAQFVHTTASPPVGGNCSTCHNGATATGKPTYHITTASQCDSSGCHTSTTTQNFTTFAGATFIHSSAVPAVANRCSACHTGQSPKVQSKNATHIATTAQCDGCHTATNTSNYTTFMGATFNHDLASPAVANRCSTCHNDTIAKGKSSFHTVTSSQCDSSGCHTKTNTSNYTTFLGALVNHAAYNPPVAGRCSDCHNGINALGKTSSHITTSSQCDSSGCHSASNTQNYTTFAGATFNHTTAIPAVSGRCSACHGGQSPNVTKKPVLHTATTAECDSSGCHSANNTQNYTTFLGATFSHNTASPPVAGRCSDCHGVTATAKPNWHMTTGAQCDTCHTTTAWSPATGSVDHTPYGVGSCTNNGCHNGSNGRGLSAGHIPTGTISCDGCHLKFNGTSVTNFASPTMRHTVSSAIRCDVCHNGSYTAQGNNGGALGKMTIHIPTTITGTSNDCTICHQIAVSASVAAMDWGTERMNHNDPTSKGGGGFINGTYCVDCHLRGVSYQGSMAKESHEGTSRTKDCSKSGCHKPLGGKGASYSIWD